MNQWGYVYSRVFLGKDDQAPSGQSLYAPRGNLSLLADLDYDEGSAKANKHSLLQLDGLNSRTP